MSCKTIRLEAHFSRRDYEQRWGDPYDERMIRELTRYLRKVAAPVGRLQRGALRRDASCPSTEVMQAYHVAGVTLGVRYGITPKGLFSDDSLPGLETPQPEEEFVARLYVNLVGEDKKLGHIAEQLKRRVPQLEEKPIVRGLL